MGLVSEVLSRVCDVSLGVEVSMGSGAGWGGVRGGTSSLRDCDRAELLPVAEKRLRVENGFSYGY